MVNFVKKILPREAAGGDDSNLKAELKTRDASKLRIGELLFREGLITKGQLDEALGMQRKSGGKIVENLIALGYLDSNTFTNFLVRLPGIASIKLENYSIGNEIVQLVPAQLALKYQVIPIDKMGKDLTVGMVCPLHKEAVLALESETDLRIRPLLISMADLNLALESYYPGEQLSAEEKQQEKVLANRVKTTLKFEGITRLARELESLPSLPEKVTELRNALEDPDHSMKDVAEIVRTDPSLSAKLIGLANSPAFGFTHTIDNVDRAVALLGIREVMSVALSTAVVEYFKEGSHFDYKEFWRRSTYCGTAAKIIANVCGEKGRQCVFAAGLLHNLGQLVFAEVAPAQYKDVAPDLPHEELVAREQSVFGVSHMEVGYILGEKWNLPREILEPVRFHASTELAQEDKKLVTIVALAARMSDLSANQTPEAREQFVQDHGDMLDELHLSEEQFNSVLDITNAVAAAGA